MKTSEIFRAQREALMSGELQWVQHTPEDTGQSCLVAACYTDSQKAMNHRFNWRATNYRLEAVNQLFPDRKEDYTVNWNDHEATFNDIITVLERCEKLALMNDD